MVSFLSRTVSLLGAVSLLALVSCSSKPEKLVPPEDDARLSSVEEAERPVELVQELRDVRYSQSKEGGLQWEMVASSVEQTADGPTNLENVKITYYSDDGRVTVLTADSGLYEDSTRNAALRGNVVVMTSDGNSLRTDALTWNQQSELLEGEGYVTMTRGESVIKGRKFELSPEDETFRIYNVEGTVHQEDMNP
jgi:LPS export ABC transporter protein LptC